MGRLPRMQALPGGGDFQLRHVRVRQLAGLSPACRPSRSCWGSASRWRAWRSPGPGIYAAQEMGQAIVHKLGPEYFARNWMRMNYSLFSALKLEKIAMFIILTLIILVAAFGIASTLFMMVTKKTREIAILKSMGATRHSIMQIFIMDGLAHRRYRHHPGAGPGAGHVRAAEALRIHQAAPGRVSHLHPAGEDPGPGRGYHCGGGHGSSAFWPPCTPPGRRPAWTRWRPSGMSKRWAAVACEHRSTLDRRSPVGSRAAETN